jgi:hypothetical protein
LKKPNRITIYASHGRVSIKKLKKIVEEHIVAGNKIFALRALNELKTAIDNFYKEEIDQVKIYENMIESIDELGNVYALGIIRAVRIKGEINFNM